MSEAPVLPRAKPTAQERLDEVARRYERPLTTNKTLTDELTLDEFWRFAVWELFKGMADRKQDHAWKLKWKRKVQETRQAIGHWTRVWREVYHSAEPTLRYCAQRPQTLAAYVDGLQQVAGLSKQTMRKSVHRINSVFRLAGPPEPGVAVYEYGLDLLPIRLRACAQEVLVPERIPVAYSDEDLAAVWEYCSPTWSESITTPLIRGVAAWAFWRAYFAVLYYLGLRPAEAARLQWAEIRGGRLESEGLNRKQNLPISKAIHPRCLDALEAIRGQRTWVFRWFDRGRWVVEQTVNDHGRVVLEGAGISASVRRQAKGLYGFRKKHFTDCERAMTGAGTASLGHGSEKIGRMSYKDSRQLDGVLLSLPDLSGSAVVG